MKTKQALIFNFLLFLNVFSVLSLEDSFFKKVIKRPLILPSTLVGAYGISYALFKILASIPVKPKLISFEPVHEIFNSDINYYLFAHGLVETHKQALWYTRGFTRHPFIIDGHLFTYNYPDATEHFWRVNWMYTSLGQYNEIIALKKSYEQALEFLQKKNQPSEKIILFGVSRGAATILNFVGRYNPQQVKALILEAPFDSTRSLSNNIFSRVGLKNSFFQTIGHYGISAVFWQHSVKGECVKDYLSALPKELPILLICSKKDKIVPWQSTYAIYKILRQNGHPYIHIFIADKGSHIRILQNEDGEKYQRIVHAFYKKYGCCYNEVFAQEGEIFFQDTQPLI